MKRAVRCTLARVAAFILPGEYGWCDKGCRDWHVRIDPLARPGTPLGWD